METSPVVRDRIIAAADKLYEESGHRNIPTVDAVRKLAKVNINDASNCMREWRCTHANPAEAPQLQVPEKLQLTCTTALYAMWTEAVNLSSETLRMVRAGWDAERAETEALSEQIASACAAQEEELLAAKSAIEKQTEEIVRLNEQLATSQRRADAADSSVVELRAAVIQAEARWQEIERRANNLHQALQQTHADYAATATEQAELMRTKIDEVASLRGELEAARQTSENNAAVAQTALLVAVEEAARLRGRLEAMSDGTQFAQKLSKHQQKGGKHSTSETSDGDFSG